MWSTLAYLVFRKIKSPTYCAKAQEYTLAHCLLAPLKKFPSSDANPVQSPLAEFCVPCVPSGTWGNHPHSAVPQNRQAPWLPPVGPVWPISIPGGERPVPARSGAGLGPTGASLVEVTGEAGKQENHFHFSASLRLETKHTVVSNPHNPPLWGGQAERLPAVVRRHKRRAGLACRLGRLGAVPTGDPRPCTHFCRKERNP